MNAVLALAKKDGVLLLRDRTGFVVTFVSPLIYAVFFGFVFGERLESLATIRFNIVAVDEDGTESSAAVLDALRRSSGVAVELAARSHCLEAFRRGVADVCIIIPAGFGNRIKPGGEVDPSMIEIAIKPGLSELGPLLRGIASSLIVGQSETEGSPQAAPDNAYAIAFPQGMTWGLIGCTAAFGLSLVVERRRGTLPRLLAAPIMRSQILAGKAGACFATSILLGAALFGVSWIFFAVCPHSLGLLALALFSVSIAFVGIMMFLAVWGRTEQAASSIIWTVLLGMSMLGGGMVPRFLMPSSLQQYSDLSPIRWAILAMEGAVWRDFTLGQMVRPCGILISIGLSFFVVGVAMFRWAD